ncbi:MULTISPECIES: flagellar hook-basal body complex protein [Rhodopseudomonas]|uniref:Flagellar hook protein FlgE n=1 Tax=Rhodopseudomonas palustris TaxID=1076 RepID=A0A0D7EEK2_RHOPL|nr:MULTISPECIES: flagellar hook-basal body complex protein [Rhodopseudomonas]KIZ38950.1 flagellar hook protein FlgE [Rhodopseudomonas palustris]MDF3811813.1 flagellar hook-basal body complex protein [Rhodopseudomonas sp. BAL398]WOK20283.1 flagellar hook-basal body complex protein [Rhodopseudomonas sp. BAL398]
MGIFGALTTSVAGLRANSYALENISGNIANSQTTAFKRIDTSFLDLIPQTGVTQQLAGSVTSQSRSTNTIQGSVQSSSVATYMAINGDGFFAVQKPGSFTDNSPVFTGVNNYTRRGDFSLDKNGYLVNGAGYYLEGVPIDPTTGNPSGGAPEILKFQNDFLPSQQTTKISYRANLASYPLTTKHNTSVPGSELLRPADFVANPQVNGTQPPPFGDNSKTGLQVNSKNGTAVTGATLLSGASPSDSTAVNFAAGDVINVNGTDITVTVSGGANDATHIPVDSTITALLGKIDAISGNTGTASTVTAGAMVLHTGTSADLTITSTSAGFASLGLTSPVKVVRTGGGSAGTGTVIGADNQTFLDESISGGATTAYDGNGAPVNVQLRWAKTDSATLGTGHTDTWNLFYQTNPNATGTAVSWVNAGTNFSFGANGQMNPVIGTVTLSNLSVSGVSLGDVTMSFGTGGLTQFADTNGNVQVNQLQQDGYAAGQLVSVSVSNQGRVVGAYSNGRNIDLAEVSIATFNGPNFLKRLDGGAFEVTNDSGAALFGKGGSISGSSLESSNTDIADEFTKLIVTQQAYSANTKVITTANTMVQDLLNVIR